MSCHQTSRRHHSLAHLLTHEIRNFNRSPLRLANRADTQLAVLVASPSVEDAVVQKREAVMRAGSDLHHGVGRERFDQPSQNDQRQPD